jgi:hypothetical protein
LPSLSVFEPADGTVKWITDPTLRMKIAVYGAGGVGGYFGGRLA